MIIRRRPYNPLQNSSGSSKRRRILCYFFNRQLSTFGFISSNGSPESVKNLLGGGITTSVVKNRRRKMKHPITSHLNFEDGHQSTPKWDGAEKYFLQGLHNRIAHSRAAIFEYGTVCSHFGMNLMIIYVWFVIVVLFEIHVVGASLKDLFSVPN